MQKLSYQSGFNNEFVSEAMKGALPQGRNSPQKVNFGLYAEQLSGSPFTAPRNYNKRSWLYRMRPSVLHPPFQPLSHATFHSSPFTNAAPVTPNQLRWQPLPIPEKPTDFIDGIFTIAGGGSTANWSGLGVHVYVANASMKNRYFYNADGEMLVVPQVEEIIIRTEFGILSVGPSEIAVIPRGVRFAVDLLAARARGYLCENYGMPLQLPDLGPIGANGLASPRDFLYPVAAYEDKDERCEVIAKFSGNLWRAEYDHSPLDVVAWHGNYAPYKYDLKLFNTVNTVSFDHPDPSIFTVLTSPSYPPGTANVDFVIFPPRFLVAEDTFRPPYFHRNIMSEFMGLVYGGYDAKDKNDFVPGGFSLHNCMSAHGPDANAFHAASTNELKPVYMAETMAFMFESRFIMQPTSFALNTPLLQYDYYKCWQDLPKLFRKSI